MGKVDIGGSEYGPGLCNRPQFRILLDKQIEDLHSAALRILERTGVAFESQEALDLLTEAGADVSNPDRVKIPSHLVEQALRTAPKTITIYTRDGELAMVLNGRTGSHFGAHISLDYLLDPYTKKRREFYVEDIADMARLYDALPNIEWSWTSLGSTILPAIISGKIAVLQSIFNCSKPIMSANYDVSDLREKIDLCSIVAGGKERLREKPFFISTSEPTSPLMQGRDAVDKSLLCAEEGIPNAVYGMPMAGATVPATFAACLAIASAEILSQLVVIQLKNPGAPVILGAIPSIMDMKTAIFPYGAPEMSLMAGALTELCHYYNLPMLGSAGATDAGVIGIQAAEEVTYQVLVSSLTGADLVHDVGLTYHCTILSPELVVLVNETIDMVKVLLRGIQINEETLCLDLIERLGPKSNYLAESHTLKHFRKFWMPKIFDRSNVKKEGVKDCEDLLNEKTIELLETHKPKPLAEDLYKELKKVEKTWFKRLGLKHEYPKRV